MPLQRENVPSRPIRPIRKRTGFSERSTRDWPTCRTRANRIDAATCSARLRTLKRPIAMHTPRFRSSSDGCISRIGNTRKPSRLLAPFVTEQPDQVEAIALLADAYQATDRDAEAISLLEQSVEESPELFATLGQVYQDAGRWRDAARAFQGAVEQRPQNLSLRAQWATALLNAGESQRAREVLEEGSAGSSRNSRALVSVVRSAAPYAGLRRRRSDRAAADCARSESARRTAAARTDLPRAARASESRRCSRTDHLGPSESGGCRGPDERHVPERVLRFGNRVRRASAVRQGDRPPHAGARLVADSAAGRHPARAIAAGSRQERRRRHGRCRRR